LIWDDPDLATELEVLFAAKTNPVVSSIDTAKRINMRERMFWNMTYLVKKFGCTGINTNQKDVLETMKNFELPNLTS
jgi:hypothetical protein